MDEPEPETLAEKASLQVEAAIKRVRDAGLVEKADLFSNAYWGYVRAADAYRWAIPFVDEPGEYGCDRASGVLHVTTFTFNLWSALIPGAPRIDNEEVRRFIAADEDWHREEDRRMRRDAGEEL